MNFKFFILFVLVILSTGLMGQSIENLNGYKYVFVPTLKYSNGVVDTWGISSKLGGYFSQKGFTVITEKTTPPKDFLSNQCLLLRCSVTHTDVVNGYNEVSLSIKNCRDEIVYSNTGRAMGLSLQDDYNKATKRAFGNITDFKYFFNPQITPEIDYPKVENTRETEVSLNDYFLSNNLDKIEGIYKSYQSDNMGYYKIALKKQNDKFIAIIIESGSQIWKTGEVKAVFEPSSIKGTYSVKWYMGDKLPIQTFGVIEQNGSLAIEFKDQNGNKRQDRYVKMFPLSDGESGRKKKNIGVSGSGFFVSSSGLIATNAHVIEDATSIEVVISNDNGSLKYKARVVLTDIKNDVALIQIDDTKFNDLNALPYGISENADIGETSFTIGYPLNDIMGNNYKVTDGIISAKSGISDDVRYFQVSIPLQPGNSGGPLFNKQGNIIGITSAKLNGEAIGIAIENVNYAIKATYLLSLMKMLPNVSVPFPTKQLSNKELKDQVKVLKNYVCLIRVTE